jgi:UDP-N-acetylmuramate--alanine ligase
MPKLTRRVITYGIDEPADVSARSVRLEAFGASCAVVQRARDGSSRVIGTLNLRIPGRHNLLNALGAVAVGLEAGVPFPRIATALAEFHGAERRFQMRGEERGVMVVDDYGHHPTEIAAVIAAARAGINRRVVVVFQPHRYSRTSQLMREFAAVLNRADEIVLTDIYSAGEPAIPGITIDALAEAVRAAGSTPLRIVRPLDELPAAVAAIARRGDLVITLGAGSIGTVGDRILAELRKNSGGAEGA